MDNNNWLIDAISLISFSIAIQNLQENNQQTQMLKDKLENQDNVYLKKIVALLEKSIEQNILIIEQNEKLLRKEK